MVRSAATRPLLVSLMLSLLSRTATWASPTNLLNFGLKYLPPADGAEAANRRISLAAPSPVAAMLQYLPLVHVRPHVELQILGQKLVESPQRGEAQERCLTAQLPSDGRLDLIRPHGAVLRNSRGVHLAEPQSIFSFGNLRKGDIAVGRITIGRDNRSIFSREVS